MLLPFVVYQDTYQEAIYVDFLTYLKELRLSIISNVYTVSPVANNLSYVHFSDESYLPWCR